MVLFPLVFMAQLVRPMTIVVRLLFPVFPWFLTLGTAMTPVICSPWVSVVLLAHSGWFTLLLSSSTLARVLLAANTAGALSLWQLPWVWTVRPTKVPHPLLMAERLAAPIRIPTANRLVLPNIGWT